MTPKQADLPHSLVHKRMEDALAACHRDGRRPSVLAFARSLGLSNTTFRRRYPDLVQEITGRRTASAEAAERVPSTLDTLIARNARLRNRNRELTTLLALAAAQVQHLSLENARLRAAVEEAAKVTKLQSRRR